MEFHRVSVDTFDQLAAGDGDTKTIAMLSRARLSRTLLLISRLSDNRPELAEAVAQLSAVQRQAPRAAEEVLRYPWVGVWAAQACRPAADPKEALYLQSVAAAALARAGLSRSGSARFLPTIGLPGQPVHEISSRIAGHRLAVLLDDLDPYRHCHGTPVANRLTGAEREAWTALTIEAWELLARFAPARLTELAIGLRSIVPQRKSSGMSASHSDAFGGFASSFPGHPAQLAATMVHEFQHSKLSALLDLVPLYDNAGRETFFAPWRSDPRPLSGAIQGIYAFIGVAALWQTLRAHPPIGTHATWQFAQLRAQIARLLPDIEASRFLTTAGHRLLANLRQRLGELMSADVPAQVDRDAARNLQQLEKQWLASHAPGC